MSKSKLSKKEKQFVAKLLKEEFERKAKLPRIKSELHNRNGGRVLVEFKNGSEAVFYYVETGAMKGWQQEE